MASRSLKPASYLASAAAANNPPRSPRPPFARTSSTSSTKSTDDASSSRVAAFRTLSAADTAANDRTSAGASTPPRPHNSGAPGSPVSRSCEDTPTPSRKRSKPIAIELPPRNTATSYTPLTGRGDHQKGGYFPDHIHLAKSYNSKKSAGASTPDSPSSMSASSSQMSSPTADVTPRGPTSFLSPSLDPVAPILIMPKGKYHPSNYSSPNSTRVSTPTAQLPPTNLSIPPSASQKTKSRPSGHQRNNSDVKRKLQQYQRDMIAQARLATSLASGQIKLQVSKPVTPDLLPITSPGPCTPFNLEDSGGYIAAGTRRQGDSLIGKGLEREEEMVKRAIETERSRAENRPSPN